MELNANKIGTTQMIKSILRLLCIFSIYVLICDIGDILLPEKAWSEYLYDVFHVLQLMTVVIFIRKHKLGAKDLKIGGQKFSIRIAIISILLGFFTMMVGSDFNLLLPSVSTETTPSTTLHSIFFAVFAGLFAPIFEEIEFRGLLFNNLNHRRKTAFAVIFSSFMFMILHTGGFMISAFIVGCISALVFLWTGNLIYSMLIHFGGNAPLGLIVLLSTLSASNAETDNSEIVDVSNNTWQTAETLVFDLFMIAIMILMLLYIYKKRKSNNSETYPAISNEEIDQSSLPYYVFYFVMCLGSTIVQLIWFR